MATNNKVLALASKIKENKKLQVMDQNGEMTVDAEQRMAELDASEKQKTKLNEWGINYDDRPVSEGGLSMLKASELISDYIAEQKRIREEARSKPATEAQIKALVDKFGANFEDVKELSRGEASDLIRTLIEK